MARQTQQVKEEIRTNIIKFAMELFLAQGIAGTSMQQIANKVHISHRTLYRYFKDKDELAESIAIIQRSQLEDIHHASLQTSGTGFTRIKAHIAFLSHYQCMLSTLRTSRFLAEYDYYVSFISRGKQPPELLTLTAQYECLIVGMLRCGQEDGSIRKDLDAIASSAMFVHIYIYTVHQMAACYQGDGVKDPPDNRYIQSFFAHYLQSITNTT